jgi:hypothetical protein
LRRSLESLENATLLAIEDNDSGEDGHLQLEAGDIVQVIEKSKSPLWKGKVREETGYFPISCCDIKTSLLDSTSLEITSGSPLATSSTLNELVSKDTPPTIIVFEDFLPRLMMMLRRGF